MESRLQKWGNSDGIRILPNGGRVKQKTCKTAASIIMEGFSMNERYKLNAQLAQMLKGGVIMDVTNPEQARIAEAAGAGLSSGAGCG